MRLPTMAAQTAARYSFGPYLRVAALAALLGAGAFSARGNEEIPFVPTPIEVVDRMLDMAEMKPGDVLYDLGSGDGRIVIRAAKRFGVRAVGIEMDPELIQLSWKKAREEGVTHLVEFRREDALKADVSPATVVTLYMFPWFNRLMRPVFQTRLRPGARVVAHDFGIEGWEPAKTEKLRSSAAEGSPQGHEHTIYLWVVGKAP
ncbi:MAG TPA: methyltransferase domain-containing protein [Candidatus Acidoferrales bacterium]|nr:methyltransferase domain-containing protein [Candidatus Acidoferrales bacterium]